MLPSVNWFKHFTSWNDGIYVALGKYDVKGQNTGRVYFVNGVLPEKITLYMLMASVDSPVPVVAAMELSTHLNFHMALEGEMSNKNFYYNDRSSAKTAHSANLTPLSSYISISHQQSLVSIFQAHSFEQTAPLS